MDSKQDWASDYLPENGRQVGEDAFMHEPVIQWARPDKLSEGLVCEADDHDATLLRDGQYIRCRGVALSHDIAWYASQALVRHPVRPSLDGHASTAWLRHRFEEFATVGDRPPDVCQACAARLVERRDVVIPYARPKPPNVQYHVRII